MKRIGLTPENLATRREFLSRGAAGTGLLALGSFAPEFLVKTAQAAGNAALDKDGRVLVLIKLGGGNDGLNMVVPTHDDTYYKFRSTIAIPKKDTLKLDDDFGLNPNCAGLSELYNEGHLAVIRDVGYPNSTHSHFSGQDFYERGGGLEFVGTGWLGRYLDAECPADQALKAKRPAATHISRNLPILLRSKNPQPVFSILSSDIRSLNSRSPEEDETAMLLKTAILAAEREKNEKINYLNVSYMNALVTEDQVREIMTTYKPDAQYPQSRLARDMRAVASMVTAGMGTRLYSLDIGGFDTHGSQVDRQGKLLGDISGAVSAFFKDLAAKGLADKVIVMPFSEFGRRPYENGSIGTDHGTNSAFFVAGTAVNGGLYGTHSTLPEDKRSDIPYTKTSTDFRQLYATIVDRWLDSSSSEVLKAEYENLEFLKPVA